MLNLKPVLINLLQVRMFHGCLLETDFCFHVPYCPPMGIFILKRIIRNFLFVFEALSKKVECFGLLSQWIKDGAPSDHRVLSF